jgi:hypothetical protein
MFCPNCNAEFKDANGRMTRRNPAMHMTSGFRIAGDTKTYLHCSMCGHNEVDPDAEQPKETVDPVEHLELSNQHKLLVDANAKLKADHAAVSQELVATKAELAKAQAKLAAPPPEPSGVTPGAAPFNPPAPALKVPAELPPAHSSVPVPGGYPKTMKRSGQGDMVVANETEEKAAIALGFAA